MTARVLLLAVAVSGEAVEPRGKPAVVLPPLVPPALQCLDGEGRPLPEASS